MSDEISSEDRFVNKRKSFLEHLLDQVPVIGKEGY